jgi:uncharacterized small protein (DUF1192 family)
MTDTGVFGFPVGTPVTLVKEDGANLVVTDGTHQATEPKSSFTNDLKTAQALAKPRVAAAPPTPVATPQPKSTDTLKNIVEMQQKRIQLAQAELEKTHAQRKAKLQAELETLDKNIAAAKEEISKRKAEQRPVRETHFTNGKVATRQGPSAYTLSANASSLQNMEAEREKLQQQLDTLK